MNQESKTILGVDVGASKIATVLWNGEVSAQKYEQYPRNITESLDGWLEWVFLFIKYFNGNDWHQNI
jgi:hypothetical protein